MVVISYGTIRKFISRYPDAEDALNNWFKIVSKANFANFNQLHTIFNSCDSVGNDRYVFNIKGNKFRLVAIIQLAKGLFILCLSEHIISTIE
jgi:mRNA interferase HigB